MSPITVSIPNVPHTSSHSLSLRSPAFFLFFAGSFFLLSIMLTLPLFLPLPIPSPTQQPLPGTGHSLATSLPTPTRKFFLTRELFNKGLYLPLQDPVYQPLRAKVTSVLLLAAAQKAVLCGDPDQKVQQGEPRWLGLISPGVGV